ncbi:hypothetical protein TGARI_286735 [Toxoplasma gondii ARI]|uniref:Uncharacterized protein n=2 Tax=Toxoplasma gondii TaxID=5811 RepID=A0A086Q1C7_TOXGO|nr:hypothetical protein TGMAS_286735 [Toxoplasma gondii MAS]KYF43802.1 hypothetical protein TGARI_286735 [Toxoplasma gondii ARI]
MRSQTQKCETQFVHYNKADTDAAASIDTLKRRRAPPTSPRPRLHRCACAVNNCSTLVAPQVLVGKNGGDCRLRFPGRCCVSIPPLTRCSNTIGKPSTWPLKLQYDY